MAHEKLKALDCYRELHDRIVAKVPIPDVARWLQEEQKVLTDLKPTSLVRALFRYRDDIPAKELGLIDGAATQSRLEEIEKDLNELDAINKLFVLQLARIETATSLEKQIGFPNSKLHLDFEQARKLLESSAELKFKLGIYAKVPENLNINARLAPSPLLEALPEDKRKRMAGIAQTVLAQLTAGMTTLPAGEEPVEADYEVVPTSNPTTDATHGA